MSLKKEIKVGESGVLRRRLGAGGFAISAVAFVLDSVDVMAVSGELFWPFLTTSGGLIIGGLVKDIGKNKQQNDAEVPSAKP
jgi:hypothetical protein